MIVGSTVRHLTQPELGAGEVVEDRAIYLRVHWVHRGYATIVRVGDVVAISTEPFHVQGKSFAVWMHELETQMGPRRWALLVAAEEPAHLIHVLRTDWQNAWSPERWAATTCKHGIPSTDEDRGNHWLSDG